jgi:hypothetical protein
MVGIFVHQFGQNSASLKKIVKLSGKFAKIGKSNETVHIRTFPKKIWVLELNTKLLWKKFANLRKIN